MTTTTERISREDFYKVFLNGRDDDESVAKAEDAFGHYAAEMDLWDEVTGAGLKIKSRKYLVKVTNTRFRGTELIDGTLHYQWQTTVAGNTFPVKDGLKKAGFRWDAADKVWYRPMTEKGKSIADHISAARDLVVELLLG